MTSQTAFSVRDLELARAALKRSQEDPVFFAERVLGVKLWSGQKRMLRALVTSKKVACRSGHKIGKSTTLAIAALWWWLTHERATVVITAPTGRQVEKILWRELRRIYKASRFPLGGTLHLKPEAGLQSADGREIVGFATNEAERIAGFSGANLLFLVDEASGIERAIFDAIEGNTAGGASIAMMSNPTQLSGVFFDAFHSDQAEWTTIHISSLECAKVWPGELGGKPCGLASLAWCEDKLRTKGENSAWYQVRVLGNFPSTADDTFISPSIVTAAQDRWFTNPPEEGALQFGVDVARFGSDLSAICYTRGKWLSEVVAMSGCGNVEVAGRVGALIREVRRGGEPVMVACDTTNNGGVADILRAMDIDGLSIVDIQYAARPTAPGFRRMRDQLWGSFKEWLSKGGAIPPDKSLAADITAPKYSFAIDGGGGIQIERKEALKARIGRSPDRADAATLATFPVHTLIKKSGFWTVEQGQDEED